MLLQVILLSSSGAFSPTGMGLQHVVRIIIHKTTHKLEIDKNNYNELA